MPSTISNELKNQEQIQPVAEPEAEAKSEPRFLTAFQWKTISFVYSLKSEFHMIWSPLL